MRARGDHGVGQTQLLMRRSELGSSLGHQRGQGCDLDPHRGHGIACLGQASGASERYEGFAVCARGSDERAAGAVSRLDIADRALVVCVGAVQ